MRIAQAEVVAPGPKMNGVSEMRESITSDWVADFAESSSSSDESNGGRRFSTEEKVLLDKVSEALARLGRVKRVGLTVGDKLGFVEAWRSGKGGKAKRK